MRQEVHGSGKENSVFKIKLSLQWLVIYAHRQKRNQLNTVKYLVYPESWESLQSRPRDYEKYEGQTIQVLRCCVTEGHRRKARIRLWTLSIKRGWKKFTNKL